MVNSALAFNIFEVPFVRGKPSYVSVRCLLNTHHPYGLMAVNHRYPCRRFSTLARVGGAGYRVLARLDHYRNRHDSRVYAMYTKPLAGPTLEWWLGRGAPLNPYLRASIIHFLREEMRPKELRLIPDDLFATEKVKDFIEWSILRSWMKEWLAYSHRYYGTAMQPDVQISSFFDTAVLMRSWRIEPKDANLTRFGLMWRVYDLVAVKGVSFRIPILEGHLVLSNGPWLLGGISGQSFMVQSRGTTQTRAGNGKRGLSRLNHQIYKTSLSSRDLEESEISLDQRGADYSYIKINYLYLYL